MKEMKKLNHTCERHFPPKKLFKRSLIVVQQRVAQLNLFLKRCLVMCIDAHKPDGITALVKFLNLEEKLNGASLSHTYDNHTHTHTHTQGLIRRQSTVSFALDLEQHHECEERISERPSSIISSHGPIPSTFTATPSSLQSSLPSSLQSSPLSSSVTRHQSPPSLHSSSLSSPSPNTSATCVKATNQENCSADDLCDGVYDEEYGDEEVSPIRWGWIIYFTLMLICFLCAVKYGPAIILFDSFDTY
jgi:hypothetical protein